MKKIILRLSLVILNLLNIPCEVSADVSDAFIASEIVPDIIDVPPNQLLEVKFPTSDKEASLGNELKPKDASEEPEINFEADPNGLYTLVAVDPDVPTRILPLLRSVKHWLVVNIQGSDLSTGQSFGDFVNPSPLVATGSHRYVFLVYKQQGPLNIEDPGFISFDVNEFAAENNLGNPVYGNFFLARFHFI